MGLTDKISGRVKQAAGDLLGDEKLHRQGSEEEEKAIEKEKLARQRERVEAEVDALDAQQARVDDLEQSTDADTVAQTHTRAELEEEARARGVEQPEQLGKDELADEVRRER
jgi:uncharacterized protein YjbJ (UPF0337 family)